MNRSEAAEWVGERYGNSGHVLPPCAMHDAVNGWVGDSVLTGDSALSCLTSGNTSAYHFDVFFRQFGEGVPLTGGLAALANLVIHVVLNRSKEQMVGTGALGVVTGMQYVDVIRNWSEVNNPRCTAGGGGFLLDSSEIEHRISTARRLSPPTPTTILFDDVGPEAVLDCTGNRLLRRAARRAEAVKATRTTLLRATQTEPPRRLGFRKGAQTSAAGDGILGGHLGAPIAEVLPSVGSTAEGSNSLNYTTWTAS